MACVLKISCGSQIYRVGLEGRPGFEAVDAAVQECLPGCGAADATFGVGGEARPLTPDALEAFLATRRELASGPVVLRLAVPGRCGEPPSAAQLQPAASAAPGRSRAQGAGWAEDPRPLDELVEGLQEVPRKGSKRRSKRKGAQKNSSAELAAVGTSAFEGALDEDAIDTGDGPLAPGTRDPDTGVGELDRSAELTAVGTSAFATDLGPPPLAPGQRDPDTDCGERDRSAELAAVGTSAFEGALDEVAIDPGPPPLAPGKSNPDTDGERDSSAELASTSAFEGSLDEDAIDLGPPLPKGLRRSASCPARAIPPLTAGVAAPPDLPPGPSEVWPPTPDSTPPHSPRFDCQVDCLVAADVVTQQQLVWLPVLVPVV